MTEHDARTDRRVRVGQVFTFLGAICAYLIGSGFASGQEALQYFAAFGVWGALGALLITVVIYCYFSAVVMRDGRELKLQSTNKILTYYCGKWLGLFFEIFTPVFLFMVFVIMISGAGATLNEYFGLHAQVGRIIMAVLAYLSVILGLDGLVSVISKIGPVIIVFALIVGIGSIAMNPSGLATADEQLVNLDVLQAAPHWTVSGVIFPAMGLIMLVPFLAGIGKEAINDREARVGGFAGGLAFVAAVAVMVFGLLANIGELYDKQVPSLFIAGQMLPAVGVLFALILFAGIYTTAVPMLWISINKLESDDKSTKFKILAAVGTVVAFVLGQFPFATLVNTLYPIAGYLGILLMVCIVIKQVRNRQERKA